MNADLVLQARSADQVDMKLTNIKVGRTNDPVPSSYEEDIDMVHRWNKVRRQFGLGSVPF